MSSASDAAIDTAKKYDVVVVNFLNKSNAADVRVYQLLVEKFRLFDGVFGASDEVLGAIESGVDFEKPTRRTKFLYDASMTFGHTYH